MRAPTLAPAVLLLASALAGCADAPTAPREADLPDLPTPSMALVPNAPVTAAEAHGPHDSGVILDVSGPGMICGIPVIISLFRVGADFGDVAGLPAQENGMIKLTYTNPANGNSVVYQRTGRIVRELLAAGADWIEVREEYLGLRGKIGPSGGAVRGLSAGRLAIDLRVTFLSGGYTVDLLDILFLAGPDDPASLRESPEQCEIMEDVLL